LREHLNRAARLVSYLRVFFSLLLLVHTGFGPGLLLRFPSSGAVSFEPLAQFYMYRPVVYALLVVALVSVLAVLCRRASDLFVAEFQADESGSGPHERREYVRVFQPSPAPFVLSGNVAVDIAVLVSALAAYCFWVLLLAESVPAGFSGYQAAGVVLGSYGLFAVVIVTGLVWWGCARRFRALVRQSTT
jgi:hypothetical protein